MKLRKTGSNIVAKTVSIVFAVILWFHVTTNATFNSKYTLPIQYVGPSEGYVIASTKPDKAIIILNGTGRQLVGFYLLGLLRSEERYALVNLTGFPEGTNTATLDKTSITLGLFSSLSVESILYPDNASFTIEIDREIKRTIAVDTDSLSGFTVVDGYCITGKPRAKPEFVVIQGPSEIINTFNSVKVSSLKGKTVSKSDSVFKASLEEHQFVRVNPDEVEIHFNVESIITRLLSGVPLTFDGFSRRNRPEFTPDSLSVSLMGPESLVSRLEIDNVVISIPYKIYRELLANGDSLIAPTVTLPEGISVIDVVPRMVRFPAQPPKG